MTVLAFDTHAFVKRLTNAGMPESQAEILADEQAKLIDEKRAAKADLVTLATKTDLADSKADIIKWMFGTIGFQTLLILGTVIALARVVHP